MSKDYYSILGISREAGADEIKSAYRKLARKYHPDVNPGNKEAENKFKEINEAFSVLNDPQKKQEYDTYGSVGEGGGFGGGQGFGGFGFENFESMFSGFDDLFSAFTGGMRGRRRERRNNSGADLRYDLEISLEEAAKGKKTKIKYSHFVECKECNGSGASKGSETETCSNCRGTGEVKKVRRAGFMSMVNVETCSECNGEGTIIKSPCKKCKGRGRVKEEEEIQINIPAGVDEGHRVRIKEQGDAGLRGVRKGDLYVFIHLKPHDTFERHDNNIFCKTTISFTQAALGAEIKVPTLEGKAKLKIPPGTQVNTVFRLKNLGITDINGYGKGDQFVKIEIEVPKKLGKKQKELLKKYAEESKEEVKTSKGFFERFKEKII